MVDNFGTLICQGSLAGSPWIPLILGIAALAILARGYKKVASLTLRAPFLWVAGALLALSFSQAWGLLQMQARSSEGEIALQFCAAALLCCPGIALLGAKRPQNRGWMMVVLCLWGILILPMLESLFLPSGKLLKISMLRSCFLLLLLLMGWLNYAGTKNWLAATAALVGQIFFLAPHLPLIPLILPESNDLGGMAAFLLAILLVKRRGSSPSSSGNEAARLWSDFRDQYGLFWALRIADRFNEQANKRHWPSKLTWSGFQNLPSEKEEAIPPLPEPAVQFFKSLLNRFVSPDWMAKRSRYEKE